MSELFYCVFLFVWVLLFLFPLRSDNLLFLLVWVSSCVYVFPVWVLLVRVLAVFLPTCSLGFCLCLCVPVCFVILGLCMSGCLIALWYLVLFYAVCECDCLVAVVVRSCVRPLG